MGGWEAESEMYELTADNTWAEEFSYGIIKGIAKCSDTSGTFATNGTPGDIKGRYCWCKMTSYTPNNGDICTVTTSLWTYREGYDSIDQCAYYCANDCGLGLELQNSDFRTALFGLS